MNTAAEFISRNRDRLALEHLGIEPSGSPSSFSSVIATPRFRASAHVIFFMMPRGTRDPVLVLKVARGTGEAGASLVREAANLRAVQETRPGGFDSIPRVVAFEIHDGTPMLLETVVPGKVMKSSLVRRRPRRCVEGVLRWLLEIHDATARRSSDPAAAEVRRLIADRLREPGPELATHLPDHLLSRTLDIIRPLAELDYPLVFEHGDLSAPNILRTRQDRVGVVDWELAEPRGLPGQDLFFFLAFVAFSRSRATTLEARVAAFHRAFFGPHAWAGPYVERYARALGLRRELIRPLFVACWARYALRLSERVARISGSAGISDDGARWLSRNRYFALWRHAVRHGSELRILPAGGRVFRAAATSPLPALEA